MNIAFYTLGCKVNQYETQVMREIFVKQGHTIVSVDGDVDVFIINSCTVTAESDRKTRQTVRHYRKLFPNAVIILTGCMPQAFPDDANALSQADIVTGNTSPYIVPELLKSFLSDGKRIVKIQPHQRKEEYSTPTIGSFDERTRAYIKIEDGCERYCTYCIIPKARGFVRSKPLDEIKAESEILAAKGFSEIVLVGINLSAYGKGADFNLCDAVSAVCSVDGIKRVRLGSLEPDHISNDMLIKLSKEEKFCPQFHLSLQSGCDATLKRMNRHYDTAFYRDLVNRIRAIFPNCSITTDIMVGFAGETEDEFNKSVNFLKEIGFAKSHVFAYSRREGTVASGLSGQVSSAEKSRRSKIMIKAAEECEANFLTNQLNTTASVLFESYEDGYAYGYTPNYTRVKVKSDINLQNQIKTVLLKTLCDNLIVASII